MDHKITDETYDIGRGEIGRILRLYLLQRWLPMGYLGGFTRLRQLLILLVTHHFGRRLFRLIIPYEAQLTKMYRRLRNR